MEQERRGLMAAFLRLVLRRRLATLAVVAALSALSALSLSRAVVASSFGELFLGENPGYKLYLERAERFGRDESVVIGLDDPDFLSAEGLARLRRAVEKLEALPFAGRVRSVLDASFLDRRGLVPVLRPVLERAPADPERALARLRADPFVGAPFLARDGRAVAILVEIGGPAMERAEDSPRLLAGIEDALREAGYRPETVKSAGMVSVFAEVIDQTLRNLGALFPLAALLLLGAVWLLFRELWPALVSLAVAGIAVLWTLGLAVAIDPRINVMLSALPIIVLVVAFSDVIHLCSAYRIELASGLEKSAAILAAGDDVGRACIYTSLTTFVGFVGMSFVPTPVFRLLGFTAGFGVAVALLLALTLVPVLLSYLPRPAAAKDAPQKLLSGAVGLCQDLSTRRPRLVIAAFALLLALSILGCLRLHIDTDMAARFDADNRVQRDEAWFRERFVGNNFVDLYLSFREPARLKDPELLAKVLEAERAIEASGDFGAVLSLADVLAAAEQARRGGQAPAGALPSRAELPAVLAFLKRAGGDDIRRLVDEEAGLLRLRLRRDDARFRATAEAADRAAARVGAILGPEVRVEPSGLTYLMGGWLDAILIGQGRGLLVSMSIIALMMVLCFRSISAGLLSMIPNLLPLLAVGGTLGFTSDQVDSDALIIGLLAIGIGVDDTIHFLSRYREERERGPGRTDAEALGRSFAFAGKAILMTTLIFTVGVAPFIFSGYFTTRIFGTLLPVCLIVAVLADLLLLPAMIRVGWMRLGKRGRPTAFSKVFASG